MRISDWSSDVCSSDLFLQGHAAFRLQANVDQRAVAFDRDDGAAQHLAFEGIVSAEGFVEQSRKALLRGGVGGCFSHMGASFLFCTIQAGRFAAGLPGTIPGGKTSRGTDRKSTRLNS